jgi:hypothetical protein
MVANLLIAPRMAENAGGQCGCTGKILRKISSDPSQIADTLHHYLSLFAKKRVALVIGNSAYQQTSRRTQVMRLRPVPKRVALPMIPVFVSRMGGPHREPRGKRDGSVKATH